MPPEKVVQIEELIRRVRVLVRLAESKEHRIDAEHLLELDNDGNRSSLALIQRAFAKSLFQRCNRRRDTRAVDRRDRRFASMKEVVMVTFTLFGAIFLMWRSNSLATLVDD